MGPDELASREELTLVLNLLVAKFRQQAEFIAEFCGLLQARGILSPQDVANLTDHLKQGECAKKATESYVKLREFLTIHKIARQYLDPPEE
jgi:hypothetical protein